MEPNRRPDAVNELWPADYRDALNRSKTAEQLPEAPFPPIAIPNVRPRNVSVPVSGAAPKYPSIARSKYASSRSRFKAHSNRTYTWTARSRSTHALSSLSAPTMCSRWRHPQGFTKRPGYATHAHGLILVLMRGTSKRFGSSAPPKLSPVGCRKWLRGDSSQHNRLTPTRHSRVPSLCRRTPNVSNGEPVGERIFGVHYILSESCDPGSARQAGNHGRVVSDSGFR